MRTILVLVGLAIIVGILWERSRNQNRQILELATEVRSLRTQVDVAKTKLDQHDSRWSFLNRLVDVGRKCLPWFK